MTKIFRVEVEVHPLPLSDSSVSILRSLDTFDLVVFTSNNARQFFTKTLRTHGLASPKARVVQVGPRADLLKLSVQGKRILFPRSAIAPYDIVRQLRAKGAVVRVLPLYTARGVRLTAKQKHEILSGSVQKLYFKSPSGIAGLLEQFRPAERWQVLTLPAHCIGGTTARAARQAGFKKVSITGIL